MPRCPFQGIRGPARIVEHKPLVEPVQHVEDFGEHAQVGAADRKLFVEVRI